MEPIMLQKYNAHIAGLRLYNFRLILRRERVNK